MGNGPALLLIHILICLSCSKRRKPSKLQYLYIKNSFRHREPHWLRKWCGTSSTSWTISHLGLKQCGWSYRFATPTEGIRRSPQRNNAKKEPPGGWGSNPWYSRGPRSQQKSWTIVVNTAAHHTLLSAMWASLEPRSGAVVHIWIRVNMSHVMQTVCIV